MGKMLETLKLGENRRPAVTVTPSDPETPVQACVVDWEIGEEVPFVEVGGANRALELSPGLVVEHPPQAAQPPHPPIEKELSSAAAKVSDLTEARLMTVIFEPWPETPTPSGIAPEVITYHQPDHATSKEYELLLEKMLGGLKTEHPHVLLLVGCKPEIGTSTVLLNLAGIAARKNQRVVVVDANSARASLAQRLGRATFGGLEEVIDGSLALEQAIVKTAIPFLHVLPSGASGKKLHALTPEAMVWLVGLMRERYDLIFIDGASVDQDGEIAVQASHADGTYLVLPQGEESSAHTGVAESISRMGGRLCGLIHTHFEA